MTFSIGTPKSTLQERRAVRTDEHERPKRYSNEPHPKYGYDLPPLEKEKPARGK